MTASENANSFVEQVSALIPHARVKIAFWLTHCHSRTHEIITQHRRQRPIYRRIDRERQTSGNWLESVIYAGSDQSNLQLLTLFFAGLVGEGKDGLDALHRPYPHNCSFNDALRFICKVYKSRLGIRTWCNFSTENAEQKKDGPQGGAVKTSAL